MKEGRCVYVWKTKYYIGCVLDSMTIHYGLIVHLITASVPQNRKNTQRGETDVLENLSLVENKKKMCLFHVTSSKDTQCGWLLGSCQHYRQSRVEFNSSSWGSPTPSICKLITITITFNPIYCQDNERFFCITFRQRLLFITVDNNVEIVCFCVFICF